MTRRQTAVGGLGAALLLPLVFASAPPTGLKILGPAILEAADGKIPEGRPVAITVQNVTHKTIVAVAALFEELTADGSNVYPPEDRAHGVGMDYDSPNPADPNYQQNWIRPGQIRTLRMFSTGNRATASVKVTITGIVFEDRSSEGDQARMFFLDRAKHGREAREAAARQVEGPKKTALEKQADWYDAHGPLEVEK